MSKFRVGQRVLYTSPQNQEFPSWSHLASMGYAGYMILNARDEQGNTKPITGTILKEIGEPDGSTSYDFAPDGWIKPDSGWPLGFQAGEEYFSELDDPDLVLPGTIKKK